MTQIKFIAILAIVSMIAACGGNTQKPVEAVLTDAILLSDAKTFFKALPANAENPENEITDAKVNLGKTLFFDVRLSMNNTQSCNTCHNLSTFGVDNKPTSAGDLGKNGDRSSPSVYNAALHFKQFWDGRAKDVEEQAGMPILNHVEMNMPNEQHVTKT